jgi:hypothetical protein
VQRVAQVIEHVVAASVNHAGFENRIVEPRIAHHFFRGPFRLVVPRAAFRARTQKTEQRELPDAGSARGLDNVARSVDVDALVRLGANFAVDSRAMRYGSASRERAREFIRARKVSREKACAGNFVSGRVAAVKPARDQHHFVAASHERLRKVPPDKACTARDSDSHC